MKCCLGKTGKIDIRRINIASYDAHKPLSKSRAGDDNVIFILGNEPMLWTFTHQDVHPEPTTYNEVRQKFVVLARKIRQIAPWAPVAGPSLWGWLATQESAFDHEGMWSKGRKRVDRRARDDEPFLPWFVKELKEIGDKESRSSGSLTFFLWNPDLTRLPIDPLESQSTSVAEPDGS